MRSRGFTIVELMVAMLITSIVFALGYGALNQALGNRETIAAQAARLQAVQGAMRNLVQDFSQLAPRPVRDPLGAVHQPALLGTPVGATLTRGGWMNPAGGQRSTQQRVRYVLEEGRLYRENWMALDATIDPPPARQLLLEDVRSFTLRYMDQGRAWQDTWPGPSSGPSASESVLRSRPIAVEVTIELADWGRIVRLVEVPA